MKNTSTEPRIYVACLASYNNGVLHGAWIDAAQDADDIRAEIAAMLRESKYPNVQVDCPECDGEGCDECNQTGKVASAEEWAIHDSEGLGKIGESEDIETVAALAAAIEEHGEAFLAWHENDPGYNIEVSDFEDQYQGEFDDLADYAYRWCDDTGSIPKDLPDLIRNHINYESMGRDFKLGGDIWTAIAPGGKIWVFSNH